jgi:hypothetical protein
MGKFALAALAFSVAISFVPASAQQAMPGASSPPNATHTKWHRGQGASNRNLMIVTRHVNIALRKLSHDAHDYGGYRVKAVQALQEAKQDLQQAMAYYKAHPTQP